MHLGRIYTKILVITPPHSPLDFQLLSHPRVQLPNLKPVSYTFLMPTLCSGGGSASKLQQTLTSQPCLSGVGFSLSVYGPVLEAIRGLPHACVVITHPEILRVYVQFWILAILCLSFSFPEFNYLPL